MKNSYQATRRIECDGQTYQEGQPIELEGATAEELRRLGAVVAAPQSRTDLVPPEQTQSDETPSDQVQTDQSGTAPAGSGQIVAAIKAIIPDLDADDFTKKGGKAPKVKSVEAALKGQFTPEEITADLVAQAWQQHQAASATG